MLATRAETAISYEDKNLLARIKGVIGDVSRLQQYLSLVYTDKDLDRLNFFIFVAEALDGVQLTYETVSTEVGLQTLAAHWQKVLATRYTYIKDKPTLHYHVWPDNKLTAFALALAKFCEKKLGGDWAQYLYPDLTSFENIKQAFEEQKKLPPQMIRKDLDDLMLQVWCQKVDFFTFYHVAKQIAFSFKDRLPSQIIEFPLISYLTDAQLEWFAKEFDEQLLRPALRCWDRLIQTPFKQDEYKNDQAVLDELLRFYKGDFKDRAAIDNLGQMLVMGEVDLNTPDSRLENRLMKACKVLPGTARRMLAKYTGSLEVRNVRFETALTLAAELGDAPLVHALVERKASREAIDWKQETALDKALQGLHLPVVQILFNPALHFNAATIKTMAFSNVKLTEFIYPHIQNAMKEVKVRVLSVLIQEAANFANFPVIIYLLETMDKETRSLVQAVLNDVLKEYIEFSMKSKERLEIIALLLQKGATCSQPLYHEVIKAALMSVLAALDRFSHMHLADTMGYALALLLIASRQNQAVPKFTRNLDVFIHLYQHREGLSLQEVMLTQQHEFRYSYPMMGIFWHLPAEISRQLVQEFGDALTRKFYSEYLPHQGEDASLTALDWNLMLAKSLHELAERKHDTRNVPPHLFPFLLYREGMNVNYEYKDRTLLMMAMWCHYRIYDHLVKQPDISIHASNKFADTALMEGAAAGRTDLVEDLLQRGAEPLDENCEGNNAFRVALIHKQFATAKCIFGASCAAAKKPLQEVIAMTVIAPDQEVAVKRIREKCDNVMSDLLHKMNLRHQSALTLLCDHYDEEGAKDFLEHLVLQSGFDVNARHPVTYNTLLMEAALRGKHRLVHYLLLQGAHRHPINIEGKDVYDYANASREPFTHCLLTQATSYESVLAVFKLKYNLHALKALPCPHHFRSMFNPNDKTNGLAGAQRIATDMLKAIDAWIVNEEYGLDIKNRLFTIAQNTDPYDKPALNNSSLRLHLSIFLGEEKYNELLPTTNRPKERRP